MKTKHMDSRYHFVHDVITDRSITVEKIATTEYLVDTMSKPA